MTTFYDQAAPPPSDHDGGTPALPPVSDTHAVDAIAALLSGKEWDAGAIEAVADIVSSVRARFIDADGFACWLPADTADRAPAREYDGIAAARMVVDPEGYAHCPICGNTEFRYQEAMIEWRTFGGQEPAGAEGPGVLRFIYDTDDHDEAGDDWPGILCEAWNAGATGCGARLVEPEGWEIAWF